MTQRLAACLPWLRIARDAVYGRLGPNGWGLLVVDRAACPPPFSVRYGYTREWRLGRIGVQVLRPLE